MLRPDYNKFIELFNEKNGSERYKFECIEKDKHYHLPFGKVMDNTTVFYQNKHEFSVNIDIFPFDNAPDDDKIKEKMYNKMHLLYNLDAIQTADFRPKGNMFRRLAVYIVRTILRLFPENYFIKKIAMNAVKYAELNTKCICNFIDQTKMSLCDKSVFNSLIDGEFEGKLYKIPVGYDQLLKALYGSDYMQLPPVEQRVHHEFEAYVKE